MVNGTFDSLFEEGSRPEWDVWFLLHYVAGDHIVPAELSRPRSIDRDGFVPSWIERLIIPSFADDGGGSKKRLSSDLSPSGAPTIAADPVVNVHRRVS